VTQTPCDRRLALQRRGVQQADQHDLCPQQHHGGLGTELHEIIQGDLQVVTPGWKGQDGPDGPRVIGYLGHFQVAASKSEQKTLDGIEHLDRGRRIVHGR